MNAKLLDQISPTRSCDAAIGLFLDNIVQKWVNPSSGFTPSRQQGCDTCDQKRPGRPLTLFSSMLRRSRPTLLAHHVRTQQKEQENS